PDPCRHISVPSRLTQKRRLRIWGLHMAMSPRVAQEPTVAGALTAATFAKLERGTATPSFRLAQNAVTQVTADDVALDRNIVFNTDHSFSNVLDDWSVTNQKQTGRCWMFAGMNLLRVGAMRQ